MDGFKKIELAVFMLIGKFVAVVGFSGGVITILFDRIAGRVGMGALMGPMQMLGLLFFIAFGIFGIHADIFLNDTIKPMVKKYLEN